MIVKRHLTEKFAIIPNACPEDRTISWEARGLLCYLLVKPQNWKVSVSDIVNNGNAGQDKVYRMLTELRVAGYIRRVTSRDDAGRINRTEYTVFDEPLIPDTPLREKPDVAKPDVAKPDTAKPGGNKKQKKQKPIERESASANGLGDFEKARAEWPSGFADSREQALNAWEALSSEDQAAAVAEIGRFVAASRGLGRKHLCTLGTYLTERRWQPLPQRAKALDEGKAADAATAHQGARQAAPVRLKPSAFQKARPDLFPDVFGEPQQAKQGDAA